jgi:hypothetical protein
VCSRQTEKGERKEGGGVGAYVEATYNKHAQSVCMTVCVRERERERQREIR